MFSRKMRLAACAVIVLLACLPGEADDLILSDEQLKALRAAFSVSPETVPENARVVLDSVRREYFIGENVLVHYTLENTGGSMFKAEFGGDSRGSHRHAKFHVTATDEQGRPVPDAYPLEPNWGGHISYPEITPGKPYHESISINRYLRISEPGTYVIRIHHESGWKETTTTKFPSGEIRLTFNRPTQQQAKELVRAWAAEPEFNGASFGKFQAEHADFSQIREPAYLPILTEMARTGNVRGIQGVGSIPTPDSTRVLLELEKTLTGEAQKLVGEQMRVRLPNANYLVNFSEDMANRWEKLGKPFDRWMSEQAWDDSLHAEIRELARRYMEGPVRDVACGAFLLERCGRKEDADILIPVLNREIPIAHTQSRPPGLFPQSYGPCLQLCRAIRALQLRGMEIPGSPATPAEEIMFLVGLRHDAAFRPPGWIATCSRLLQSENSYLRVQGLESLPAPMSEEFKPLLLKLLMDGDVDVSRAACEIIGRDQLKEFTPQVLQLISVCKDECQFRAANDAAVKLGEQLARLRILTNRPDEPQMLSLVTDEFYELFENARRHSSTPHIDQAAEGRRIAPHWKRLVLKHADHLQAGGKFRLPHPDVSKEMFPEQWNLKLDSGELFP